jgi:hypothetical protein
MPSVNEVIKTLQDRFDGSEVIAFGVWTSKDVNRVAKESGFKLDKEEANNVLNILTEDFDPIIGINNEIISDTIADEDEEYDEGDKDEYIEDEDIENFDDEN